MSGPGETLAQALQGYQGGTDLLNQRLSNAYDSTVGAVRDFNPTLTRGMDALNQISQVPGAGALLPMPARLQGLEGLIPQIQRPLFPEAFTRMTMGQTQPVALVRNPVPDELLASPAMVNWLAKLRKMGLQ